MKEKEMVLKYIDVMIEQLNCSCSRQALNQVKNFIKKGIGNKIKIIKELED